MKKIDRLKGSINSLEFCLKQEGVSQKEIDETKDIYLKKETYLTDLEEYEKYLSVKKLMLERYWNNRWRF